MADLSGFNANDYPAGSMTISEGPHAFMITESKLVPTKADPSVSYLYLKLACLDESDKGKVVDERLNINHSKDQVRLIALQKLAAICKAVGVVSPKDSTDLHDKPFGATVKHKKTEWQGEERMENVLSRFVSRDKLAELRADQQTKESGKPAWA